MHTKYLKRIIAFVILLSMLFTTVAMAIPYGQAKKLIRNGYNWENVEKYVKGKGIMKGFPDGKFYEDLNVKRADAIIMIDRAFKLSALVDLINREYKDIFDDVDENEYYFDAVYIAKLIGITKGRGNNKFHPKQSVTIEEVILLIERAMEKSKYFEFDDDIDLRENYKDLVEKNKDLKDFATRGEIAAMLYYVLTGSKYDGEPETEYDLKEITRTIEEDEVLAFDYEYGEKDSIIESIEDLVDDLEYVQFTKPLNKDNNFLYDEYDEDSRSNSFVTNSDKYYVDPNRRQMDLSEVTIVPKKGGVLEIEYMAYDDEGDSYKGLIKITVEDVYDDLEDIEFTGHENTPIKFIISKFKEVFKKEFEYTSDDEISFELPDKKFGTLYFDENNDGKLKNTEKIEAKNSFKLKQMNRIYFYPAADFVDEKDPAVIEYTVEDKDGNFYEGKINIKVSALLDKLTIDEDDDFGEEVKDHLDEFDDYVFETIKFEKLDKDDDFDLNFENKTSSLFEIEFYITHLEDVVFNPGSDFDGATLKYTVTTDDGLEFTGLVTVEVDD
jgi:hypothetical protein